MHSSTRDSYGLAQPACMSPPSQDGKALKSSNPNFRSYWLGVQWCECEWRPAVTGLLSPLTKRSCAGIFMVIGVSEWLVWLSRPLQKFFRLLRPPGHLIISADNTWPLHEILDLIFNPAMKPIKACIGKILRSIRLRPIQPRFHAYSLG